MSKTESSLGILLGILTFDLPAKSTRTLSLTQAYDRFRTQIVLGSFTGKLNDKSVVVKEDGFDPWGGSVTFNDFGGGGDGGLDDPKRKATIPAGKGIGTVALSATDQGFVLESGKADSILINSAFTPDGVTFTGTVVGTIVRAPPQKTPLFNSKATNANTTYYGAITVGLGEYKKWQGNYAVLKINTVTEKAILRIYAD